MIFKRLIKISVLLLILTFTYTGSALSKVTPDEAAKLGTTLTGVGAEKAGNKEGTIPPYTGGLTTPPDNFVPGSGIRPDPFGSIENGRGTPGSFFRSRRPGRTPESSEAG